MRGPGVMLRPPPARGHRGNAGGGRLAAHRRHGRAGGGGLPADHRPQEGPLQDLRRQVRRPSRSRSCSRPCAPTRARSSSTARTTYCTALVALDPEPVAAWAQAHALGHLSLAELAAHERVRALIATAVEEVNRRLPRWQTIKRFAVLPCELTVEEGDVTPSLKLRRQILTAKHRELLESLYDGRAG